MINAKDRAELERIAGGDRRPVTGDTIDSPRHLHLEQLRARGLLVRDPLRWYPPSYQLTSAGQGALAQR